MSLIGQLDKGNPIYALDDGVVESGSPFEFDSIEEVAQSCVKVMTSLLETRATKDIILCGWSYGGVVAVEIAKLIKQSTHLNLLQVKSISMFDSPLRAAVVSKSEDGDDSKSNNNFGNNAQDSTEVMKRAQDHFSACTTLLRKYHKRPTEQKPLTCPIFDIRPEHSEYQIDPASVEELTIGLVVHPKVTGNHWTMIYGEHAKKTAEVMQSLWSSHHK